MRGLVSTGEFERAERFEAQLYAELLEDIASNGAGPMRAKAQLALQTRKLWLVAEPHED